MSEYDVVLPEGMKSDVTNAFNQAVEKKVSSIKESLDAKNKQLDRKIKVLDMKEQLIRESAAKDIQVMKESLAVSKAELRKAKKASDFESKRNKIKLQLLENRLIKEAEEAVEVAIDGYVENNKFEKLEMEDREKLVKLLNLFEEMLSVFGKKIVDITEEADVQVKEVESEANEAIDELVEENGELEAENEELKESVNKLAREKAILEIALENRISHSELDDFMALCESIEYTSKAQFRKTVKYIIEKHSNGSMVSESSVNSKLMSRKAIKENRNGDGELVYADYLSNNFK